MSFENKLNLNKKCMNSKFKNINPNCGKKKKMFKICSKESLSLLKMIKRKFLNLRKILKNARF